MLDLRSAIRTIPDDPKPGIMFRDITTLLGDARAFRRAVDELVQPYAGTKVDKIAGIEARGFILGGAVAHQLSAGFVPIRKKGKLPFTKVSVAYSLEYGNDEMEMHDDAIAPGERVILVDDLIATGAEGPVALPGEDDHADRVVIAGHVEGIAQFEQRLRAESVALLRTTDGDLGDAGGLGQVVTDVLEVTTGHPPARGCHGRMRRVRKRRRTRRDNGRKGVTGTRVHGRQPTALRCDGAC
jgi:adenine phosphoribosyltransferase